MIDSRVNSVIFKNNPRGLVAFLTDTELELVKRDMGEYFDEIYEVIS